MLKVCHAPDADGIWPAPWPTVAGGPADAGGPPCAPAGLAATPASGPQAAPQLRRRSHRWGGTAAPVPCALLPALPVLPRSPPPPPLAASEEGGGGMLSWFGGLGGGGGEA